MKQYLLFNGTDVSKSVNNGMLYYINIDSMVSISTPFYISCKAIIVSYSVLIYRQRFIFG